MAMEAVIPFLAEMLKVECESCKAPYQVDERRVPETGLKMRCPKCGHTFLVNDPSKVGAGAGAPRTAAAPSRAMKQTMVGVGTGSTASLPVVDPAIKAAPTQGPAKVPSALTETPSLGGLDDWEDVLPVAKPAPPKIAKVSAKAPGPDTRPTLDEIGMPSLPEEMDLPATVQRTLAHGTTTKPTAPTLGRKPQPNKRGPEPKAGATPPAFQFDIDLPSALPADAGPDLPAVKGGGGLGGGREFDLDADLPAAKGFDFEIDLPAAKGPSAGADLPIAKPAPPPPRARGPLAGSPAPEGAFDFGAELPSPKGSAAKASPADLPAPKPAAASTRKQTADIGSDFGSLDLPIARGPGAELPELRKETHVPKSSFGNLPIVQAGDPHGVGLPALGGGLPSPKAVPVARPAAPPVPKVNKPAAPPVPKPNFGELDLPSLQDDFPLSADVQSQMPVPVSDERLLPDAPGKPPAPNTVATPAFGELDLPILGAPADAPSPRSHLESFDELNDLQAPDFDPGGGDLGGFGELDLPNAPSLGSVPPLSGGAGGGLGFGEVDLGGDSDGGPVLGPPPATSAGTFAFQEASLAPSQPPAAMSDRREQGEAPKKASSKAPKIVAGIIAAVVLGGAALQLTPLGAYGHVAISDKLRAGEYAQAAVAAAEAARKNAAADTFGSATAASDELAAQHQRTPRSRPLAAYAAFFEFQNQVRFGGDGARAAKVTTFLAEVPKDAPVPYVFAARAAEMAERADWPAAKKALEEAVQKEPKDGVQVDLAYLRGEIALAQRDFKSAQEAFGEAMAKGGPSARGHWGLARAHAQAKNVAKAKEELAATLAASKDHAGAQTLQAWFAWDVDHDEQKSLEPLNALLEPAHRKALGPAELATALATKGFVMLDRDRASEARAAFDEAVKIDPRNAQALVGQGRVLYADSRYTEALTRFDEATKKDPANIAAIIGSAMTKISLERLADAKAQLTAARQIAPKDMTVALWLAKTEEALGNRAGAEQLFGTAIDLADPQNPDAIQAYASFASFLAAQGRTTEAQAKLEMARGKLPDSAALQRAFGDVAAAQGHFDEAVGHFESALEKNPSDIGTRFRLGVTYRRMRKLDAAASAFDQIVAIDRDYPGIALERGLLFEESGDVQKALEQFQSAFQKAPNDIDLALRVGAAFVAIGKVDEALPLLEKVRQQRPNSAEANHFIGRAHLKQGGAEAASAMRFLQRAVELDPNRAEYHLYVAWAANDASPAQLGLARTHVDKALTLDKLLADGYWQRGVVELREGAINDAIKDLKYALELKPGRHEAHAALAECYEQKNETGTALAEWSKAIAGDGKVPLWRYRYGRMLLDRGSAGEAARHLAFALDAGKALQPRPGWLANCAFEAGEALRRSGQVKPAIEAYNYYLELAPPTAPDRRDAIDALRGLGAGPDR